MWTNLATLSYPSRLNTARTHALVHDGQPGNIMGKLANIITDSDTTISFGDYIDMEVFGAQFKMYAVEENTNASPVINQNNGGRLFQPNSPGTYWVGTVDASYYGSNVVVHRRRVHVNLPTSPPPSPVPQQLPTSPILPPSSPPPPPLPPPLSPPPPALQPPPTPPPLPYNPPPYPSHPVVVCDVTVIGCGLAGITAAASATHHGLNQKICLICPSLEQSTSVNSGRGWLLMPNVNNASRLLDELQSVAHTNHLGFDRARAQTFVNDTKASFEWMQQYTPYVFESVPSFQDATSYYCRDVQSCCNDGKRNVRGHGQYTCDDAARWYKDRPHFF